MKRLFVLIIIGLLALVACDALPEGRYGVVPLDGQAVTPGMTYEAQGRVFVIITPVPTSATATGTPVEISTPTSTPTETTQPTPTQEMTPLPTATATAPPKVCELKAAQVIRIRKSPSVTTGTILGSLATNEVLVIDQFVSVEGYLWAHTLRGWFAVRSGAAWWVYGTMQSEICVDVPGWPSGVEPPTAVVGEPAALLFHAAPGANAGNLILAYGVLRSKGIRFGVKAVNDPGLCRDAVAMGGICIYRSVHPQDCPNLSNPDPKQEAWLYMLALSPYINQNTRASYIEITNECNYQDGLAWYNVFLLEAIRLAREWRWPPLVLPTFGPGAPEVWWLDPLHPALAALLDSGGLFGFHAYSISREIGLCQSDIWLGYRHRMIRAKLDQMGLNDLPIVITEAARGTGNQEPSVSDFTCWYDAIKHDAGLFGVALWTAGDTEAWPEANLDNYTIQIAQLTK